MTSKLYSMVKNTSIGNTASELTVTSNDLCSYIFQWLGNSTA